MKTAYGLVELGRFSMALVLMLYLVRRVLRQPKTRSTFPQLSYLDMFDINSLKVRSFGQILDRLVAKGENAGCKAAWLPTPDGPVLSTWDPDFVTTVNCHPVLKPRDSQSHGFFTSSATMGTRDTWNAIMSVLQTMKRRAWTPDDVRIPVKRLLATIEKNQHEPMDLIRLFQSTISQVVYALLFGEGPDDTFFDGGNKGAEFLDNIDAMADPEFSPNTVIDILAWLPGVSEKEKAAHKGAEGAQTFLDQKRLEYEQIDEASISDQELFPKILDLCQDTGKQNLVTACYFLAKYPNIQDALRNELRSVFPESSIPETSKALSELKLCRAVLDECLRLKPSVTIALAHTGIEDTEIGDNHLIKEGTKVNLMIHAILRDEENYEDPLVFDPYRWLTDDQQKLAKMKKAFRPFGFGSLACPGQTLARVETMTILASVVKRFRIKLAKSAESITEAEMIDPKGIFTRLPPNLLFVLENVESL